KTAEPDLKGDITKGAGPSYDHYGNRAVSFSLTAPATKAFADLTTEYAPTHRQIAIVLDGELQSAPSLNDAILDGNVEISRPGGFSEEEADQLVSVLRNPLRAPLKIVYEQNRSATLGTDTIRHGISASIAAVVFVSLFMLLYYRFAGLTANV